jgi:hypothetical protein
MFGIATAPATPEKTTTVAAVVEVTTETEAPSPVTTESTKVVDDAAEAALPADLYADAHPFRSILFGLFVLGVPLTAFWYYGGMRWVRRAFSGAERAKYRKVDDDDREK